MPMKTISRIEKRIESASSIRQEDRESLRALLKDLRQEVEALDPDAARTVATYAELSVQEATREATDAGLLEHAIQGLRRSTEQFRAKHHRLTSLVEDAAAALSRIGLG